MLKNHLFWKLYPTYVLTVVASVVLIVVLACAKFRSFYLEQTAADLVSRIDLVSHRMTALLDSNRFEELDRYVKQIGPHSGTRFTVVLKDGRVIADSSRAPETLENHGKRPEVVQAWKSTEGLSIRKSETIGEDLIYVARPYKGAVIRASIPVSPIREALLRIYLRVAIASLLLLFLVFGFVWKRSSTMSDRLNQMRIQLEKLARGDFSEKIQLEENDPFEFERLGQAMNEISIQLDQRISTILNQKNEQEAVFSSIAEGICAVDANNQIRYLNPSAAKMLSIPLERAKGMEVEEVIQIPELLEIMRKSIESGKDLEGEVVLRAERYLRAHVSPLKGKRGTRTGLVLVVSDITRLRQLENHRKDFVANVSHELRTPLTSIQGFAETLLNQDDLNREEETHFIGIINKHARRLGAIIEDLLMLSRIEKETEHHEIPLEAGSLREVVSSAVQLCAEKAFSKKIKVELECKQALRANINSELLVQAVVNLVDNAIKYNTAEGSVRVCVEKKGAEYEIAVQDRGPGIAPEHLPRLFERFYRVDKARSRKLGGTGLGLSIVKHIALAHQGRVEVQSKMQEGSVFSIFLPAQSPENLPESI